MRLNDSMKLPISGREDLLECLLQEVVDSVCSLVRKVSGILEAFLKNMRSFANEFALCSLSRLVR